MLALRLVNRRLGLQELRMLYARRHDIGFATCGNGRSAGCVPRHTTPAAGAVSRDPAVVPEKASRPPHRRSMRWADVTDDAYVNAETVGISTDVSGIVSPAIAN